MCLSRNVRRPAQEELANLLGVNKVDRHERYLRLLTLVGRNRGICFSHIKERLLKCLRGWKGRMLSFAGREILVKVVASVSLSIRCNASYCQNTFVMTWTGWWLNFGGMGRMKL